MPSRAEINHAEPKAGSICMLESHKFFSAYRFIDIVDNELGKAVRNGLSVSHVEHKGNADGGKGKQALHDGGNLVRRVNAVIGPDKNVPMLQHRSPVQVEKHFLPFLIKPVGENPKLRDIPFGNTISEKAHIKDGSGNSEIPQSLIGLLFNY